MRTFASATDVCFRGGTAGKPEGGPTATCGGRATSEEGQVQFLVLRPLII